MGYVHGIDDFCMALDAGRIADIKGKSGNLYTECAGYLEIHLDFSSRKMDEIVEYECSDFLFFSVWVEKSQRKKRTLFWGSSIASVCTYNIGKY